MAVFALDHQRAGAEAGIIQNDEDIDLFVDAGRADPELPSNELSIEIRHSRAGSRGQRGQLDNGRMITPLTGWFGRRFLPSVEREIMLEAAKFADQPRTGEKRPLLFDRQGFTVRQELHEMGAPQRLGVGRIGLLDERQNGIDRAGASFDVIVIRKHGRSIRSWSEAGVAPTSGSNHIDPPAKKRAGPPARGIRTIVVKMFIFNHFHVIPLRSASGYSWTRLPFLAIVRGGRGLRPIPTPLEFCYAGMAAFLRARHLLRSPAVRNLIQSPRVGFMQLPSLDDLLAAFEGVREETKTGGIFRARDAEDVVRVVSRRGEALGGYLRQLTRLVRLAALCSPHVYLEFFEITLRSTQSTALGPVIARRLTDFGVPPARITLDGTRLRFLEPEMWAEGDGSGAFEISLRQVPRLALLHSVLCRFLHYPRLCNSAGGRSSPTSEPDRGLLWPLLVSQPTCSADDVARRVQAALNSHLTRVFETTSHTARQVQTITGFLRSRVAPGLGSTSPSDLIDDQLLMDFWETTALKGEEGFRLYRSAVTKMLRYRRSLLYAQAEFRSPAAIGSDTAKGEIDLDRLNRMRSDAEPGASSSAASWSLGAGEWQSPMLSLRDFFQIVKVLNKSERLQLSNFLDGCDERNSDDVSDVDVEESTSAIHDFRLALGREFSRPYGSALFGSDKFDIRLTRTLLRVDVFDPCQRSIGLRAERGEQAAVDDMLQGLSDGIYRDRECCYLAVREQLKEGMLACLYILGSLGDANALVLMARLFGRSAVTYFAGLPGDEITPDEDDLSETARAEIAARLRAAFVNEVTIENEGVRTMVRAARKSAEQTRRSGFKREHWTVDHCVQRAIGQAVGELVRLLDEIDRLLGALHRVDRNAPASSDTGLVRSAQQDVATFTDVFRKIYHVPQR